MHYFTFYGLVLHGSGYVLLPVLVIYPEMIEIRSYSR